MKKLYIVCIDISGGKVYIGRKDMSSDPTRPQYPPETVYRHVTSASRKRLMTAMALSGALAISSTRVVTLD